MPDDTHSTCLIFCSSIGMPFLCSMMQQLSTEIWWEVTSFFFCTLSRTCISNLTCIIIKLMPIDIVIHIPLGNCLLSCNAILQHAYQNGRCRNFLPVYIKCSANQAVVITAMKAPTVCMTITGFRNPLADIVSRAGLISDPLEAVDLRHCWPHEMQLCD